MKWINVKDELPKFNKEVLVLVKGMKKIYTGCCYKIENNVICWEGNYGENDDINGIVKYWMPFPLGKEYFQESEG